MSLVFGEAREGWYWQCSQHVGVVNLYKNKQLMLWVRIHFTCPPGYQYSVGPDIASYANGAQVQRLIDNFSKREAPSMPFLSDINCDVRQRNLRWPNRHVTSSWICGVFAWTSFRLVEEVDSPEPFARSTLS